MSVQDERIRYVPKYHKDSDGGEIYDMVGTEGPLFIFHLLSVFNTNNNRAVRTWLPRQNERQSNNIWRKTNT